MKVIGWPAFILIFLFTIASAFWRWGAQTDEPKELTVFAAASLTESFQALGARFEYTHGNTKVRFNFGGSQQLVQQLVQGAGADVFASANMRELTVAVNAKVIDSATVRIFARSRLVLILPGTNPAHVAGLRDLAKPQVKIVLADSGVPAGHYALEILGRASTPENYGTLFTHEVLKNVVSYEENVRAVFTKVKLGECDAGIVYTTDAAVDTSGDVRSIEIPDKLNSIAVYPAARARASKAPRLAQEFLDYLVSHEGAQILAGYGFLGGS